MLPAASGPAAWPAVLLFVVVLVIGAPLVSLWDDRVLAGELAARRSGARVRAYLRATAFSWALAIVALWLRGAPTLDALTGIGLGPPADPGDWLLLALGSGFAWLSRRQLLQRTTEGAAPHTAAELRPVAHLLPQTRRQLWAFRGAAVSAGFTEEVVYRGWLLGVLTPLVGPWLAVPGAALVSGAAQLQQGAKALARGTLFGLVTGLAFALTGNLWGLVVAHVAIDLIGGEMAWRVRDHLRPPGDGVPEGASGPYRTGG